MNSLINNLDLKKGSLHILTLIFLTNTFINIDHGIIPAASHQIKQEFLITDAKLGLLGTFMYLGVVTGGCFAGKTYLKFRSKYVLAIALVFIIVTLYTFTIFKNVYVLFLLRFLTGNAQVIFYYFFIHIRKYFNFVFIFFF